MDVVELIAAPVGELRSRTTPILILERLPSPCSSAETSRTPSTNLKAERKKLEEISSELSATRESRKPASKMNFDIHHACDLVLPSLPEACTSFREWRNAGSNGAGAMKKKE
nr:hypothetical protein Iba_chr01eCG8270 [Ipomoea batatas]